MPSLEPPVLSRIIPCGLSGRIEVSQPVGFGVDDDDVPVGVVTVQCVPFRTRYTAKQFNLFVTVEIYLLDFEDRPGNLCSVITIEGFEPLNNLVHKQVQPALAGIAKSRIGSTLGVSEPYSSDIWSGKIPHPRHWQALAQLAGVSPDA